MDVRSFGFIKTHSLDLFIKKPLSMESLFQVFDEVDDFVIAAAHIKRRIAPSADGRFLPFIFC